jgi:hypothetical protein
MFKLVGLPFRLTFFTIGLTLNLVATLRHLNVIYFSLGQDTIDSSTASYKFAARGLPVINGSYTAVGGGGYRDVSDRLLVGGMGEGGGEVLNGNDFKVDSGGGSGFSVIGWILRPLPFMRIYPLVGVGGGGGGVSMIDETDSGATLQKQLMVSTGGMRILTGIGAELRIGWRYGFIIGIQAGYRFADMSYEIPGATGASAVPFRRVTMGVGKFS